VGFYQISRYFSLRLASKFQGFLWLRMGIFFFPSPFGEFSPSGAAGHSVEKQSVPSTKSSAQYPHAVASFKIFTLPEIRETQEEQTMIN
jgi:hypothetical protein